ncbi:MAG TPA: hypothetical protein PK047_05230 [Saprospiraceae bacterium]|jgi:hypothetical protein|nr:hypothetical protein [Saprospiraceae bacterium]HRO08249.1 hypothetical protein [Saprospiraceae bacterium]HRP41140.1 hypothetical protein [Saprospiraceae bacterium]
MIKELREDFNRQFSLDKYELLLQTVIRQSGVTPVFRVAESPFFIPEILRQRLLDACAEINRTILRPDIKSITQKALYDDSLIVPGEDAHTTFIQMDFGVTIDENGDPMPKLIEVQGFPSVYFFQYLISDLYQKIYNIPDNYTSCFDGRSREEYKQLMHDILIGNSNPREVVLLEIEPEKQTTYIDMVSTAQELGLQIVCLTKVFKKGNKLYYKGSDGQDQEIRKIYNRVIFDELEQRKDLQLQFSFNDDLDVKWIGHPNWFYRISKFLLPYIQSKYVPETYFLNELKDIPDDLENYVLKPLFSFAGAGVIIDVTREDIDKVSDASNYILQRKVTYEPVLKSPDEPVKVEIRMMMVWPEGADEAFPVTNLVRLSKGKMIGVKYNKDKDWVGSSIGYFAR